MCIILVLFVMSPADEVQNGSAFVAMPASKQNSGSQTVGMMALPSNGMVPSATNLNIGMNFWGRSAAPAVAANHGKVAAVPSPPSTIIPNNFIGARDGVSSDLCLQVIVLTAKSLYFLFHLFSSAYSYFSIKKIRMKKK